MINTKTLQYQQDQAANKPFGVLIEGLYLFYIVYTNIFSAYGIEIDNLGVLILGISAVLILFSSHPVRIFESAAVTLSTLIAFYMFFVVGLAHQEFMMQLFDQFATMMLSAIIFVFLIRRPGFFKRILITMYIAGVFSYWNADVSEYGRLQGGGTLTNPNTFAAWMAFCCLGLAMWGFHARNMIEKVGTWGMMFYGLVIIGLTVSRGALVALGFAMLVFLLVYAPRSTSMVNIFITILFIGIGTFAFTRTPIYLDITESYEERWDKDTGREELWPAALEKISQSPLLGYGSGGLKIVTTTHVHSSHNPFLTTGLIGGIFPPLLLGVMYVLGFFRMEKWKPIDGVFWLPAFFVYVFVMMNFSNWYFIRPWAMLTIVAALEYRHLLTDGDEPATDN